MGTPPEPGEGLPGGAPGAGETGPDWKIRSWDRNKEENIVRHSAKRAGPGAHHGYRCIITVFFNPSTENSNRSPENLFSCNVKSVTLLE